MNEFEKDRHLSSDEIADLKVDDKEAFLKIGFTHHREILAKCKNPDERWYYIRRCASEFWSVETLKSHIRADDYSHIGALPNNFKLTMPDENPSIGIVLCKEAKKTIVELAVRDYNRPMGVAVYRTKADMSADYQKLIPLMDGVRSLL